MYIQVKNSCVFMSLHMGAFSYMWHVACFSAFIKEYVTYVELVIPFRATPSDYCTALVPLMGFVA